MHRWLVLVLTGLTALAALTAVSAAAPSERASTAAAGPVISSVSPKTLASGQRTTIKGRRFVTGKRRNTVVFLGRRGKRDDVKVKATATTTSKIVVRAPRPKLTAASAGASAATRAVSGPLQVVNALGKSKASKTKVTFDEDKDGLSNEREIQLGTNPRKADTDGDGVPDGRDSDPLKPPAGGGGGGGTTPPPTDCPSSAGTGTGSGPASSFDSAGVLSGGRSVVAHSDFGGTTSYCLYRKRPSEPAFQLVVKTTTLGAGKLTDAGAPTTDDLLFRTDSLTATGVVAGANTVAIRGAVAIAGTDVPGWARLNQTCTLCGGGSVVAPSLALNVQGDAAAGAPEGSLAVFERRLQLASTGEWFARPLDPAAPDDVSGDGYLSSSLTISSQHPALARGASTVGDPTDSGQPWINVELRRNSSGSLFVIATDSGGTNTTSVDLTTFETPDKVTNVYLTVDPIGGGKYDVRFKSDRNPDVSGPGGIGPPDGNPDDIKIVSAATIPGGMTSGWLSLRTEAGGTAFGPLLGEFDQVDITGQPSGEVVDNFGGPIVVPPPGP